MRNGNAVAFYAVMLVFAWQLMGARKTFTRVEFGLMPLAGWIMPAGFAYFLFEAALASVYWWTAIPGFAGLAASLGLYEWTRRSIKGRMFSYILSHDAPKFVYTEGPFAYIRHPFYASYLLGMWSGTAVLPSIGTIGTAAGMSVYFYLVTQFEEGKFARTPLAPQYGAYRRRTGRFLPRLNKPAPGQA